MSVARRWRGVPWRPVASCVGQVLVITALITAMWVVSAPSPALFGAFLGTAALSILGMRTIDIAPLPSRAAQGVLGATIATQISGAQLQLVGDDLPLLVVISVLVIGFSVALGQVLTRRGVSRTTAALASVAGGSSTITAIADDLGADRRVVVVVQYLRVLLVLATLIAVLASVSAETTPVTGSIAEHEKDSSDYVFVALSMSFGIAMALLRFVPAPALLGSLVSGSAMSTTALFADAKVPDAIGVLALAVIGAQAASGFTRETFRSLGPLLPAALLSSILLIIVCAVIGAGYSAITGATYLDGYLATSPGGLPVILAAVIDTGGNAALVSSSQLIRLLAVIVLIPLVMMIAQRRRN